MGADRFRCWLKSAGLSRWVTVALLFGVYFAVSRFQQFEPTAPRRDITADRSAPPKVLPPERYTQLTRSNLDRAIAFMRVVDHAAGRWATDRERNAIELNVSRLIAQLQDLRVSVVMLEPDQTLAQGEWNYRRREIRIHPGVLRAGLRSFSRTLHHEVLHVTQSCSGGGLTRRPRLIGFESPPTDRIKGILQRPPYAGLSQEVHDLESEAFLMQDQPELVRRLLRQFCLP